MPPTRFIARPFCVFQRVAVHLGTASGLRVGTTAFRVLISATCAFFIALERGETAVNIEEFACSQHALFRRYLSLKTLFVMASGVDLGGWAGEHHEHQLGVCGPIGGAPTSIIQNDALRGTIPKQGAKGLSSYALIAIRSSSCTGHRFGRRVPARSQHDMKHSDQTWPGCLRLSDTRHRWELPAWEIMSMIMRVQSKT